MEPNSTGCFFTMVFRVAGDNKMNWDFIHGILFGLTPSLIFVAWLVLRDSSSDELDRGLK